MIVPSGRPLDLVCLGEPMVEFSRQADGLYRLGFGGDTSNCAVAAARQGARVGYITQIGADWLGDALVAFWDAEGVDRTGVRRLGHASTGSYVVTYGPQGHQFGYARAGSAASLMAADDLPRDLIARSACLHVSGISQAISPAAAEAVAAAIDVARKSGALVSYDTNLRTALWPVDAARAAIHQAAALCDVLLPSLDDAGRLTGLTDPDAIADFYLGLGPRVVALTLGRDGALVATPEARERIPGHAVEVVDATGAGDAFDGAFLAWLLRTGDPFVAARHANQVAALSTTSYGAVAAIPHRQG